MGDWELYRDGKTVGPASESDVLEAIRRGALTDGVMARPVGKEKWRSLRAHAPFAAALEEAATNAVPAGVPAAIEAPKSLVGRSILVGGTAVGVVMVVGLVVGIGRCTASAPATAVAVVPTHAEPEVHAPTPPSKPKSETFAEQIMATKTLDRALMLTRGSMRDVTNEANPGSVMLGLWAWKNAHWSDFEVAKNETSYALMAKDSDAERTKRLCVEGSIVEIAAEKFEGGKVDTGLLLNGAAHLFHFTSVASSGKLVQGSYARFCGVVTGKFDYSNSAGGTGHAIDVVGMFDLPENRQR